MSAPKYPPTREGVPRITGAIETYFKCGIRYQFEVEERTRYATVPMVIGSAVAAGAELDNREKIEVGHGPSLGSIVERAAAEYESEIRESEIPESHLEIERGKDEAVSAARVYGTQISPQTTDVISAEEPIIYSVGKPEIELAGTPDVITSEGIGDYKVGQPKHQSWVDRSRQLTRYALLRRLQTGSIPSRVWIDSISRLKNGWKAERLYSVRIAEDFVAFMEAVNRAVAGITAGVALPAPEGAWWCSSKWCPFWKICPAVAGRKE